MTILTSTDMMTMTTTLTNRGQKMTFSVKEAREAIVRLSQAIMPLDDATIALIYKRLQDSELANRKMRMR